MMRLQNSFPDSIASRSAVSNTSSALSSCASCEVRHDAERNLPVSGTVCAWKYE